MRTLIPIILSIIFICGCKTDQKSESGEQKPTVSAADLTYQAPESWVAEKPASRMRRAQFRWPGISGADDAECAVYVFPGTGGNVQDNLNRWYTQFKQPQGASTEEAAEVEKRMVNDLPVTVVYVTGTYLKSMAQMTSGSEEVPNSAMLAAVIETPRDPWFFKAVGPVQTVDHWRKSFDDFVSSVKYISD